MKIESVDIVNFLSISEASINLSEPKGLVLVDGPNGVGKSALVSEPILWCLKGTTIRGAKGDDIVRLGSEGGAMVRVVIHHLNQKIDATRYQASNLFDNDLHIVVNGNDVTPRSKRESQKMLDDLIGLTPALLSSILVLGEGFENRFAQYTPRQKMEFIEDLVGDAWDEPASAARRERDHIQASITMAEGRVQQIKQGMANMISIAESGATQRDQEVASYHQRLGALSAERQQLQGELGDAPDPLAMSQLADQVNAAQVNANEARGNLRLWKRQEDALAALQPGVCPTCQQPITAEYREQALQAIGCEVEAWTAEVEEHAAAAQHLINQKAAMDSAAHQRAARDQRLTALEFEVQQVQATIQSIEARPLPGLDMDQLNQLQGELGLKVKEIEEWRQRLPYVDFWVAGFSAEGVRSYRIDSVLNWLNERLEHYTARLYDGQASVKLRPERQLKSRRASKNEITIDAVLPNGNNYFTASRGQRRKIDLALHFALQDLAVRVSGFQLNLLVADEVLDSLDADSTRRSLQLLQDKAVDIGTVFLVTHEDDLRSQVARVWAVEIENGVSRVDTSV